MICVHLEIYENVQDSSFVISQTWQLALTWNLLL